MARRGLPKAIIKKYGITKKAWAVFRGRRGSSESSSTKVTKKGGYKMAKKRGRRRGSFTLPMAIIIPAAAGPFMVAGPPGWGASPVQQIQAGNFQDAARIAMVSYTFFDPQEGKIKWDGGNAIKSLILGFAVHWVASRLGVNRALGRARVPIFRI